MFTGIVAAVGSVLNIQRQPAGARFEFATGALDLRGVGQGDSIAVNGACLTVIESGDARFSADLSQETLACTTLGSLDAGQPVNLERALSLGDGLGGHLVTGHVDGIGEIRSIAPAGDSLQMVVEAPAELARYIARKGSVCVDGTSLTVNSVDGPAFAVMIVPHTQTATIIRHYRTGSRVNIEVDLIARYLERMLQYTARSTETAQD